MRVARPSDQGVDATYPAMVQVATMTRFSDQGDRPAPKIGRFTLS